MWHVLRAQSNAKIALGLRARATKKRIHAGALNGEIMGMLEWIPARAGDTFFVPAGTIHAIGGGLAICEVQQSSDRTYRLFDHHRKPERELHLRDALAVATLEPIEGRRHAKPLGNGRELLAECEYFRTERVTVQGSAECLPSSQAVMYVAISGEGEIAGEPFQHGEAWLSPAHTPRFSIDSIDSAFIVASAVSINSKASGCEPPAPSVRDQNQKSI
jgi:mannose-6-phosphate isomerase